MKKYLAALILVFLLLPTAAMADEPGATYRITFTATWSNQTHPHPDFPTTTAHFSPLIGGIHNATIKFWEAGQLASVGIERMAEQGQTPPLTTEVNAAISAGHALSVLTGTDTDSPGSTTINSVQLTKDFPLVTLVTMIAPSPDWFTGVSGLSLLDEQGNWVDSKTVMLYPYDAGTEQDGGFTLDNPPMDQNVPIASLANSAFFTDQPVGSFTFTRLNYANLHLTKTASPTTPVDFQGQITYTLVLSNSGDTKASGAVLTDTLPGGVAFAQWVQRPSGATQSSNQITWTGAVTAGKTITFTFVASHTGALYGETIINTAVYSHTSDSEQASTAFTVEPDPNQAPPTSIFLPLLLKDG
ncbi:MAG: DUF11 domain-containing protein [Anaerolineales bacterium]|nr:DUF11 domain-containing protein [Anaerolineales bacterium]